MLDRNEIKQRMIQILLEDEFPHSDIEGKSVEEKEQWDIDRQSFVLMMGWNKMTFEEIIGTSTTSEEACKSFKESALLHLEKMEQYIVEAKKALKNEEYDAVNINWGKYIIDEALIAFNDIARCNGAAVVRIK